MLLRQSVKARRMAIQADRVHFLNTKVTRRPLQLEAATGQRCTSTIVNEQLIKIAWSGTKSRQWR
jgi:hypothetical protein